MLRSGRKDLLPLWRSHSRVLGMQSSHDSGEPSTPEVRMFKMSVE